MEDKGCSDGTVFNVVLAQSPFISNHLSLSHTKEETNELNSEIIRI
jgi:hypothetical protein